MVNNNTGRREWIVVSVPGNESEPTLWFAMHRTSRRSSKGFLALDDARAEARKRNA
jgi:hypothetical protein